MIKWCAYCQRFMQEVEPYDDFSITHGLCHACVSEHPDPFAIDVVEHAHKLRKTFSALFDAGRREDFAAATRIVDEAIAANCRPVDLLVGMISPMLYEIGDEWKRGVLSFEDECRFTAFSEKVVELVESRIGPKPAAPIAANAALLFLMNAPGNRHDLGVHILSVWLEGQGANVQIIDGDADLDAFMDRIAAERPKCILISMALSDQRDHVAAIAQGVQALPRDVRPRVIVGGYPVKAGLIQSIAGAEFLRDAGALRTL